MLLRSLENVDIAVLMLCQPWAAAGGLGRADIDRRLQALGTAVPLGPLYFQKMNRAVLGLEGIMYLRGAGTGRNRTYSTTPLGFAAMILNLQTLRADPTLDATEFEFKREIVALFNLMLDDVLDSGGELSDRPDFEKFFDDVDGLSVGGKPLITPEIARDALDVRRLLRRQRERVQVLAARADQEASAAEHAPEPTDADVLGMLEAHSPGTDLSLFRENPILLSTLKKKAGQSMPRLVSRAKALRYRQYLGYLDGLEELYGTEFKVVDFASFRRRLAGGSR